MKIKRPTIGADPEVFVCSLEDGYKSAHEFPCGEKWQPRKTEHGHVQIDGTALEFNVIPATNKKDFIRNVKSVVTDLETIVTKHDPMCYLSFVPYVNFGQSYLETLPPMQRMLGCNADWNAYTGHMNVTPDADVPIRTAAGHIHIGWGKFETDRKHHEQCCEFVKELDFYLGLPSLKWDSDYHRRELYGKAGSFRAKPYGVEYRVLSNTWCDDESLIGFVYARANQCYYNWQKRQLLTPEYGEFARICIDTHKTDWDKKAPQLAEFLELGDL